MDELLPVVNLVGAIFSPPCTMYFWLVRAKSERANLRPQDAKHVFNLGACHEGQRELRVALEVRFANFNVLPHSVLDARVWLQGREGNWMALNHASLDQQTPQSLNVVSLESASLRIHGVLRVPSIEENEQDAMLPGHLERFVKQPCVFQIELRGLEDAMSAPVLPVASVA